MDNLEELNQLCTGDLSDILSGATSKEATTDLLQKLENALTMLMDASRVVDIQDRTITLFLRRSLPVLIELFLRRQSRRFVLVLLLIIISCLFSLSFDLGNWKLISCVFYS